MVINLVQGDFGPIFIVVLGDFLQIQLSFCVSWCPIIWQFSKQQIEACGTLACTKSLESEALRAAFGALALESEARRAPACTKSQEIAVYGALHAQNLEYRKILEIEAL